MIQLLSEGKMHAATCLRAAKDARRHARNVYYGAARGADSPSWTARTQAWLARLGEGEGRPDANLGASSFAGSRGEAVQVN